MAVVNTDNADERGSNPPAEPPPGDATHVAPPEQASPWARPTQWNPPPPQAPAPPPTEWYPTPPADAPPPGPTEWYPTEPPPQWYPEGQQQPYQQWGATPPPGPWQQPPPVPPTSNKRRMLAIGAAVGAAVLVAGATTAYFALRSDDTPAVAAGENVLRGSYPDAPARGWQVTTRDVEKVAGTTFDSAAYFGFAQDYGDVLVTSLGTYTEKENTYLVAIDINSGAVQWAVPSDGHQSYTCAAEAVDGLILCAAGTSDVYTLPGAVREYSLADGELVNTLEIDGLSGVAVSDGDVYTAGWDSNSGKGWIAKGSPDNAESGWREEYDFGSCGEPAYGGWLVAEDGVVVHTTVAVDESDGRRINPDDTAARQISSNGITVTDCDSYGDGDTSHAVRLIDEQGDELLSVRNTDDWAAIDLTPSNGRPFVLGNTAYDVRSGDELWSADDGISFTWLDGDVAVGQAGRGNDDYLDDTVVAYSLSSGEKLWENDTASSYQFFDGDRMIAVDNDAGDTVSAIDTETGDEAWTIDVDAASTIDRVGSGFVATSQGTMTFYPPNR